MNINGKKQIKRISTKILKMDENNQYGQAMTKPLPYSCIQKQEHPPTHMMITMDIFLLLILNFMI